MTMAHWRRRTFMVAAAERKLRSSFLARPKIE
jgi:hypothetical protein